MADHALGDSSPSAVGTANGAGPGAMRERTIERWITMGAVGSVAGVALCLVDAGSAGGWILTSSVVAVVAALHKLGRSGPA